MLIAVKLKVTGSPSQIAWLIGCTDIAGSIVIDNVAALLSTEQFAADITLH